MRKRLVIPLTLLFLAIFAAPVWAGVNLNINGKAYQPANSPQLEQGITMVGLNVIGKVLGADISNQDQTITIKKGVNTLVLILGDTNATLNGKAVTMPKAPEMSDGEIMVPLRFIHEAFGAQVDWQGQNQTVAVNYTEQRQGMNVEELLVKSSEAMAKYNTYKMDVDMTIQSEAVDSSKPGELEKFDVKNHMDMAMQTKPVLMYAKTSGAASGLEGTADQSSPMESEMVINDSGLYMTMPEQGWVKMNIPGMDIKALLEQSGSQDPISSLKQMKDCGVIMSYGDDRQKNGKSYWIINVTMGADSLNKYMQDAMDKVPVTKKEVGDKDIVEGIGSMMQDIFKNMQADIVYYVWVDQTTLLPVFMDLDCQMKMTMQIPAEDGGKDSSVVTNMKEKATYEIYDLGLPFTVPDVSKAVDMKEYIEKQMKIE